MLSMLTPLATLRGVERGEEHEFALIASMQGLRPSREWETRN